MIIGRRANATWVAGLLLLVSAVVAGCSSSNGSPSTSAAAGIRGGHVRVLGLWSGPELTSFEAVKTVWEKETGAFVDWEATDDATAAIADHKEAGTTPDIAILPNLALMKKLAGDGSLIPLDSVLDMQQVAKEYAPAWVELGSHGGKLYGIFYKVTNKAAVWYNPKAFAAAGYAVPGTWDDMITLADRIVDDGHTPFSIVAAKGPANGWALTDWISEIVLNSCGADLYDRWIAAEIAWSDPCVKRSFDRFVKVVSTKGYVLGGAERIVATGDDVGADPVFSDPPTAYLDYFASFAQAFIAANHRDLEPGTDYATFPFPTIDPRYDGAVTVGADVPVMLNDTPASRSFMSYLASARSQETWIKLGGFTSVNRTVAADTYRDPVARKLAEQLTAATVSRFSAGDMMPASLQRTWWAAMLDLVQDPTTLDGILGRLTAAAQDAR